MSIFFTGDTHFYHGNIILYCNRSPWLKEGDTFINPFKKVEWVSKDIARQRGSEMTEGLIKFWNQTLTPDDDVYHVGDICFGTLENLISVLSRLNFHRLYFIWGNHDKAMSDLYKIRGAPRVLHLTRRIEWLGNQEEITIEGQHIVLNHYAMRVWNRSHHGSWHLYGHSHGSLPDDPNALSMDVGIDCHGYRPITFQEVKERMSKKVFVPVDHHGSRRYNEVT